MLVLANQAAGVLDRYGVMPDEAGRAAWTVDPQGRRLEGAAAINEVLRALGPPWQAVATPYRLRPIAALEEAAYRWFAPRRARFHRFGVTPECDEPGAGCR